MPVTVRGTDILFNDGSTQSTAAAAMNTTNVLNATAGASVGAVGTYAFLVRTPGGSDPGSLAAGGTDSGSNLRYAHTNTLYGSGTPSGTWRCMGYTQTSQSQDPYGPTVFGRFPTLYLRIS